MNNPSNAEEAMDVQIVYRVSMPPKNGMPR